MTDTATATPPPTHPDTTSTKPPPPADPTHPAHPANPANPANPAAAGAGTGSEFQGHMASEVTHAEQEDLHRAQREADLADARNSNLPLTERLKAAGHAMMEGAKELNEGGKRERDAHRADEASRHS